MAKQPQEQNFYPISEISFIGSLIDERVQDFEQLSHDLVRAQARPSSMDDATVDQVHRVHEESLELADAFDAQLTRWEKQKGLTLMQRVEVRRLQKQMTQYRESCLHIIAVAKELKKGTIDAILRMSDEEVGMAVLMGELTVPPRQEQSTPIAAEQLHIASMIDAQVRKLMGAGVVDEVTLFAEMADFMPGFKRIMDTATPGLMDELGQRFAGFYLYAKALETIAEGIKSGKIQVPN